MEVLHSLFAVLKFFFGLGALVTLLGMGLLLLWFCLRFLVQRKLARQPRERGPALRKFFLEP
jgi:hypothetical protein